MDWQGTLSARDLLNYVYCPRIVFFENVLHLAQRPTVKVFHGREAHEEFALKERRNQIVKGLGFLPRNFEVPVYSADLGFRTRIDCVLDAGDGKSIIVQAKEGNPPDAVYRTQKMQLAIEAALYERAFGEKVERAFVKYLPSQEVREVPLGEDLKNEALQALESIRTMISREEIPEPTPFENRCKDCVLFNACKRQ